MSAKPNGALTSEFGAPGQEIDAFRLTIGTWPKRMAASVDGHDE
jgi:hypothetical protein